MAKKKTKPKEQAETEATGAGASIRFSVVEIEWNGESTEELRAMLSASLVAGVNVVRNLVEQYLDGETIQPKWSRDAE